MSGNLSAEIDRIATCNGHVRRSAQEALKAAMEIRRKALDDVIAAAKEITTKRGGNLAGQQFGFSGPHTVADFDPTRKAFVACVFEARFGDETDSRSFGIHIHIDANNHVSDCYIGAAVEPVDTTASIADQFITWLDGMGLCYPPASRHVAYDPPPPNPGMGAWAGR